MKTVRDAQVPVLNALIQFSAKVGAKLYLADGVTSPRPTIWFCGSLAQRAELQRLLNQREIRVFSLRARNRLVFKPSAANAEHTIVYQKYVHDNIVVHGAASGIEVVFCGFDNDAQVWKSLRAGVESVASASYLSTLNEVDFEGVRIPIMGSAEALAEQCSASRKIDLVYTWVDGQDTAWQARRKTAEANFGRGSKTGDEMHSTRYDSHDELLYSIRSAQRYFVDLGNIYVVTDRQTPTILGSLLDNVTIVDHREIFADHTNLPTFNSHAIEANLHRISGLSEQYLYMNDDVFFGSAMSGADFFDEYGRSYQFFSSAVSLPHQSFGKNTVAADAAGINNRNLLLRKLGVFAFRKFQHTALPTRRSLMFQMEKDLAEAWTATLPNTVRSTEDYSIAGALYQQYAGALGHAIPGSIRYAYFDTKVRSSIKKARSLIQDDWLRPQMFCINDTLATDGAAETKQCLMNIMRRVLPSDNGEIQPLSRPQNRCRRRYGLWGPRIPEL